MWCNRETLKIVRCVGYAMRKSNTIKEISCRDVDIGFMFNVKETSLSSKRMLSQ